MSDLWLVLDGVEDLVDGEPQQSEMLCRFVGLGELGERTGELVSRKRVSPSPVPDMTSNYVLRL